MSNSPMLQQLIKSETARGKIPVGDLVLAGVSIFLYLLLHSGTDSTWMLSDLGKAAGKAAILIANLLMLGALAFRRANPTLMLVSMGVTGTLLAIFCTEPTMALMAVPIAAYSYGRWVPSPKSRQVLYLGAYGAVLGPLAWSRDLLLSSYNGLANTVVTMVLCISAVVVPYLIGQRILQREETEHERTVMALQNYENDLARREQAARMNEVRVRNEIARELHDVVAHSLSVIIVQAQGGKALAAKHPDQAAEVLDTIADTGREALTEMRRIVGVLREDPVAGAEYHPNPGLEDIPDMVARAGDRVQLHSTGAVPKVPPTMALTVYRVVQEAITNFFKHAGDQAQCSVAINYLPAAIELRIVDNGLGGQVRNDGQGNGLRGMRERVEAMGGRLQAGPVYGGGYLVQAWLPLVTPEPNYYRS